MQAKLPPELREMVYSYLLDAETRSRPAVRAVISGEEDHDSFHENHHEEFNIPRFMRPGYVGASVALEVVHALYKAFDVGKIVITSPRQIFNALFTDRFDVGLQPFSILRAVTIHCMLDGYRTPPMHHPLTNRCKHTWKEHHYPRRAELTEHFQKLLLIENKEDFKLRIVLIQRNVRIAILAEAIVTLRGIRRQLIEDGAEVSLAWAYCSDGRLVEDETRAPQSLQTEMNQFLWGDLFWESLRESRFRKWVAEVRTG